MPSCTLIGWSLGGMVALDLTSRFPERVKKLVMIGSNPCFVKTTNWVGIRETVLEKFASDLTDDCHGTLIRFLSLQVKGLDNYKTLLRNLKIALLTCEPPDADILQGGLEILKQQDLRFQLANLQCPAQIILGSHDTFVPVVVADKMRLLNPHLKILTIDKAGHVPFLSHQSYTLSILRNFMETMDAV
jgi:pimeloyl-[acyl-carrier protein] methyl ester esterase